MCKCFVRQIERHDQIGGKKPVCKDWRSWMTRLISVSSKCSLVLWGHLVQLRCSEGSCVILRLLPCMLFNQGLTHAQCTGSSSPARRSHQYATLTPDRWTDNAAALEWMLKRMNRWRKGNTSFFKKKKNYCQLHWCCETRISVPVWPLSGTSTLTHFLVQECSDSFIFSPKNISPDFIFKSFCSSAAA